MGNIDFSKRVRLGLFPEGSNICCFTYSVGKVNPNLWRMEGKTIFKVGGLYDTKPFFFMIKLHVVQI